MKAIFSEATRVQVAVYKSKVDAIQKTIADYYHIPVRDISKHSRVGRSLIARQRVHYFCREFIPLCPLAIIGLLTGNGNPLDHSTIINSFRKINREITLKTKAGAFAYPELVEEIEGLRYRIGIRIDRRITSREYRRRCHLRAMYHKSKR